MPLITSGPPYVLDFGAVNAGGSPTFSTFKNAATNASLTPPSITEIGDGLYEFTFTWSTAYPNVTGIIFKATLNGVELSDVITSVAQPGSASAVPGTFSVSGFSTAGTLINRAALQLGLLETGVSGASDPFASTNANFIQLCEYLNTVGQDLTLDFQWGHLIKECTITTASSGTSYALPPDYQAMVDETGWNRSTRLPFIGPLTSQEAQFIKARLTGVVFNVAFRIQGNLITFPTAPSNGLTLAFEYLSTYWLQSASSSTGPDKAAATATDDVVLHDAELVIAGLKLRWLEDRAFDTAQALRRYEARLEYCKGKNAGARVISRGGLPSVKSGLNEYNIPITGYGL